MPTIKIPAREASAKGKEHEVSIPGPGRARTVSRRQHQHQLSPVAGPSHPQLHIAHGDEPPIAGPSRYRVGQSPPERSSPVDESRTYLSPLRHGSEYPPSTFEDRVKDDDGSVEQIPSTSYESHSTEAKVQSSSIRDFSCMNFHEFVELDWKDPYFLLPMHASRLKFEEVPLRLGKTQTLSIWQDERWALKEGGTGKTRAGGYRVVKGSKGVEKPTSSGKGKKLMEKAKRTRKGEPLSLNLKPATLRSKKEAQDLPTRDGPMTRAMTRRVAAEGQGKAKDKSHPPSSSHSKPSPSTSTLYEKCTDNFESLAPSLVRGLPFTTARELTQLFQSSKFDDIEEMIQSVRVCHVKSFALRHAHLPHPHIPNPGRYPPPSPPVFKMNVQRLRHRNTAHLLERLENGEYLPFPQKDYHFMWKELYDAEEEIQILLPQWYHLLNKYVGEYDELITWLRLQIPIDLSEKKTLREVKERLNLQMEWIAEKRESDIARAIDTFCGWADAQYASMQEVEMPRRKDIVAKKRRWAEVEVEDGVHLEVEVDDDDGQASCSRKRKRRVW